LTTMPVASQEKAEQFKCIFEFSRSVPGGPFKPGNGVCNF
jgi:hypothetical protein